MDPAEVPSGSAILPGEGHVTTTATWESSQSPAVAMVIGSSNITVSNVHNTNLHIDTRKKVKRVKVEHNEEKEEIQSNSNPTTPATPETTSPISVEGSRNIIISECSNTTLVIQKGNDIKDMTDGAGSSFNITRCREKLKQHYLNYLCKILVYPGSTEFLNMEDIYTDLSILYDLPKPVKSITERLKDYTEMFTKTRNQTCPPPKRLLVIGEGGSGKSTLVGKIAYDWANMKDDDDDDKDSISDESSPLKSITLLIILNLRNVKEGTTLEEAIQQQRLFPEDVGFNAEDMYEFIKRKEDHTMFVFDSYDEMDVEGGYLKRSKTNLSKILTSTLLTGCRVLVTSRLWKAHEFTHDPDLAKLYTKFKLDGFSEEQVQQYVRRFFQGNHVELGKSLLQYFEENNLCPGVASVPLMTQLMCTFWKDKNGEKIPSKISELYTEIIRLMLRQKRTTVILGDFVNHLGQVALYGLWHPNNQLVFPMEIILRYVSQIEIDVALKVGLLKRETVLGPYEEEVSDRSDHVSFFHKSFQEFCAGHFLASITQTDQHSLEKKLNDLRDPKVCLQVKMILIHACGADSTAGNMIIGRLLATFASKFTNQIHAYYDDDLEGSSAQEIQNFIELCLLCNYEIGRSDTNKEALSALFPEGNMRFVGMDPYTIAAVGYFLEHLNSEIKQKETRSIVIIELPRHGDKTFLLSKSRILQDVHTNIHAALKKEDPSRLWHKHNTPSKKTNFWDTDYLFNFYADDELWQQFKGLQPSSVVDYRPILNAIGHITLTTLVLSDVKLSEPCADTLVRIIQRKRLQHIDRLVVRQAGLTSGHVQGITNSIETGKVPSLRKLDVSHNAAGIPLKLGHVAVNQPLSHLNVSYMTQDPEETSGLVDVLAQSSATHLKEFRIHGNSTNSSVGTSLLQLLPRLLDVENLGMNAVNELTSEDHRKMIGNLGFLANLHELRIDNVGAHECICSVLSGLTDALPFLCKLEFLRIRPQSIYVDEDSDCSSPSSLRPFLAAVDQTTQLRRLDVIGIYFEEDLLDEVIRIGREHKFNILRLLRSDIPHGYDIPMDIFLQLY